MKIDRKSLKKLLISKKPVLEEVIGSIYKYLPYF